MNKILRMLLMASACSCSVVSGSCWAASKLPQGDLHSKMFSVRWVMALDRPKLVSPSYDEKSVLKPNPTSNEQERDFVRFNLYCDQPDQCTLWVLFVPGSACTATPSRWDRTLIESDRVSSNGNSGDYLQMLGKAGDDQLYLRFNASVLGDSGEAKLELDMVWPGKHGAKINQASGVFTGYHAARGGYYSGKFTQIHGPVDCHLTLWDDPQLD